MQVNLADGGTVYATQLAGMAVELVDDSGVLVPGMPALDFYVLGSLPAELVLGMPFLERCNPSIDWVGRTVTIGGSRVLALPQHEAARVELCSLRSVLKTVRKAGSTAWYWLLQPRAACLSMGDSTQP